MSDFLLRKGNCWCSGICARRDTCDLNEETCPDAKVLKPWYCAYADGLHRLSDEYLICMLRKRNYTGELRKTITIKV